MYEVGVLDGKDCKKWASCWRFLTNIGALSKLKSQFQELLSWRYSDVMKQIKACRDKNQTRMLMGALLHCIWHENQRHSNKAKQQSLDCADLGIQPAKQQNYFRAVLNLIIMCCREERGGFEFGLTSKLTLFSHPWPHFLHLKYFLQLYSKFLAVTQGILQLKTL